MHMMARIFMILKNMCFNPQLWIYIVYYFIENKGVAHERTIIKVSHSQLLNGSIIAKIPRPSYA